MRFSKPHHKATMVKRYKRFLLRLSVKSFGCTNLEPLSFGAGMDRTRLLVLAAASRARRTGINGSDFMASVDQSTECWQREIG